MEPGIPSTGKSKLDVSHVGDNPTPAGTGNPEAICPEADGALQPGEGDGHFPQRLPTYRAAVEDGSDVGVVVVGHLLVVGAQEADGLVVAVGGGVVPGDGLVAVVGDVLVGRSAQEPEESHLHHSDGVPV